MQLRPGGHVEQRGARDGCRRQLEAVDAPLWHTHGNGQLAAANAGDGLGGANLFQTEVGGQRLVDERGAGAGIQREVVRPLVLDFHWHHEQRGAILAMHHLDVYRNAGTRRRLFVGAKLNRASGECEKTRDCGSEQGECAERAHPPRA